MAPKTRDLGETPKASDFLAEVINVKVSSLFVDHRYQRGVKKASVKRLVDGWTWKRYLPIIISPRGGSGVDRYAIIDGQQRFMAAQEIGIEELPAIMIVAASLELEAELFVGANTGSPVGAGDRFRAEFLRKDERCIEINATVNGCGFMLNCLREEQTKDPFAIDAVSAIESIYDMGYLYKTLDVIQKAFGGAPVKDMTTAPFLMGVYLSLRHLERFEVAREDLIKALGRVEVKELLDMGHDRYRSMVTSRSIAGGIAAVIVEQYNYRKRAELTVPAYDRAAARSLMSLSERDHRAGGLASAARRRTAGGKFSKKED